MIKPLSIICTIVLSGSALAYAESNKWEGFIEAEGKWGNERSIGELDLFIPITQDEDTLIFADIRGKIASDDTQEGNFGLGIRQIFQSGWIGGLYAYYDRRNSKNDNKYDQLTLGGEVLTEKHELRVNAYIPESTENDIGQISAVGSVSGTSFQIANFSAPKERALAGVDAEVGYKLYNNENVDLWAYGGGYYFDASGYDEVAGPRARLELNINDFSFLNKLGDGARLTFGAEVQNDDVRDEQAFAYARIRIPFGVFGGGDKQSSQTLSALEQRMTTRIQRDVDIVTNDKQAELVSTEAASISNVADTAIDSFTVLDATDNVPVDLAAAGANSLVVLDGSAGVINAAASLNLQSGQVVVGGGQRLTLTGSNSGVTTTVTLPGSAATVNGTNGGNNVVAMAADSSVYNLTLQGGNDGLAILASNNAYAEGLTIQNLGDDGIQIENSADVVLKDIVITSPNGGAEEAIEIRTASDNLSLENISMSTANIGVLYVNGTHNGHSYNNVTIDTVVNGVQIAGGTTLNNPTGAFTATNVGGTACQNFGTINGSILTANNAACP